MTFNFNDLSIEVQEYQNKHLAVFHTLHFFEVGFHTNKSGKPFHTARLCTNV